MINNNVLINVLIFINYQFIDLKMYNYLDFMNDEFTYIFNQLIAPVLIWSQIIWPVLIYKTRRTNASSNHHCYLISTCFFLALNMHSQIHAHTASCPSLPWMTLLLYVYVLLAEMLARVQLVSDTVASWHPWTG